MTTYLLLRTIRLMLWGAFILSLAAATAWRQDVNIGAIVRYLPPTLLVLALATGFAERVYRKGHGIAPRRLWSS
jgi:hypothetical protein